MDPLQPNLRPLLRKGSRLQAILETAQTAERENEEMDFIAEGRDPMQNRIDALANRLDIHRNGVFYLREFVPASAFDIRGRKR